MIPPTTHKDRKLLLPVYDGDDNLIPDVYILEIDNSSLEQFNVCARSSEYSLVHNRGFAGSQATRYGSAIHTYLEHRLRGATKEQGQELLVKAFSEMPMLDPEEFRTLDFALSAMTQYEIRYAQENRLQVLHDVYERPLVELPFRIPLTTIEVGAVFPWEKQLLVADSEGDNQPFHVKEIRVYWTGKIDAVCLYDDLPSILDHKTTSMLGTTFFKDFELSSQTIGYVWAARRMPFLDHQPLRAIKRFVLDAIVGRKPTRTGVAHEQHRQIYEYTDDQILEWEKNTTHLVSDFLSHLLRGYFPMQTKWCVNKYGMCPYHEVCTMPANLRMTHLKNAYQKLIWSPLN